jgi:hypothetical protein
VERISAGYNHVSRVFNSVLFNFNISPLVWCLIVSLLFTKSTFFGLLFVFYIYFKVLFERLVVLSTVLVITLDFLKFFLDHSIPSVSVFFPHIFDIFNPIISSFVQLVLDYGLSAVRVIYLIFFFA